VAAACNSVQRVIAENIDVTGGQPREELLHGGQRLHGVAAANGRLELLYNAVVLFEYRLLITGHYPMSRFSLHIPRCSNGCMLDRYEKSHQNPINRVFHTFGIPMIAVSIPLFLIAPLVRGFWKIPK
jgi:hypothetical protein